MNAEEVIGLLNKAKAGVSGLVESCQCEVCANLIIDQRALADKFRRQRRKRLSPRSTEGLDLYGKQLLNSCCRHEDEIMKLCDEPATHTPECAIIHRDPRGICTCDKERRRISLIQGEIKASQKPEHLDKCQYNEAARGGGSAPCDCAFLTPPPIDLHCFDSLTAADLALVHGLPAPPRTCQCTPDHRLPKIDRNRLGSHFCLRCGWTIEPNEMP